MAKCKYYKEGMKSLKILCQKLYELPDCGCGGPLHILLDDDNYTDSAIQFCRNECLKHPNPAVVALGVMICDKYLEMSIAERTIFDLYWWNHNIECKNKSCDTCYIMTEIRREGDE